MTTQATVYNAKGESCGTVEIPKILTDSTLDTSVLHEAIVAQLANRRAGSADTKTRGEVRGGGKKPWKQKGTGRARAGSIRSPLWRKGGIIFGPHPRSYEQRLPKKKFALALGYALKSKFSTGAYTVLDVLSVSEAKTKAFSEMLKNLKLPQASLIVDKQIDGNVWKAARNVPRVKLTNVDNLHPYDVLRYKRIVITQDALKELA